MTTKDLVAVAVRGDSYAEAELKKRYEAELRQLAFDITGDIIASEDIAGGVFKKSLVAMKNGAGDYESWIKAETKRDADLFLLRRNEKERVWTPFEMTEKMPVQEQPEDEEYDAEPHVEHRAPKTRKKHTAAVLAVLLVICICAAIWTGAGVLRKRGLIEVPDVGYTWFNEKIVSVY